MEITHTLHTHMKNLALPALPPSPISLFFHGNTTFHPPSMPPPRPGRRAGELHSGSVELTLADEKEEAREGWSFSQNGIHLPYLHASSILFQVSKGHFFLSGIWEGSSSRHLKQGQGRCFSHSFPFPASSREWGSQTSGNFFLLLETPPLHTYMPTMSLNFAWKTFPRLPAYFLKTEKDKNRTGDKQKGSAVPTGRQGGWMEELKWAAWRGNRPGPETTKPPRLHHHIPFLPAFGN